MEHTRDRLASLEKSSEELSQRYRSGRFQLTEEQKRAYLVVRLPATRAVIKKVLGMLADRSVRSFLDLGAGPGSGLLAASELFPQLQTTTLVEKDDYFIRVARELSPSSLIQADLEQCPPLSPHDLVLLSYTLGEIKNQQELLRRAFEAAQLFVVIEPGTPKGFSQIIKAREFLLSQGAHLVAPCPHAQACPLPQGDWCHFSERVERTSLHRRVKKGTLGYEDEKFSYLVVSKTPTPLCKARILRHPLKRSGHIEFALCTAQGVKRHIVSRKEGSAYKQAKKLGWGDVMLNPTLSS